MALPACLTNPEDIDPQSGPIYSLLTYTLGHFPGRKCEVNKLIVIVLTILLTVSVSIKG